MKITVFTPTYNRGYIIENLYRSLQRQTCHDFEWLVVDDGSSDETSSLFDAWVEEENPFPIRYFHKENGGKCRAINYALARARGELFFTVDSDDYLTDDALEKVVRWEASIAGLPGFCGVSGSLGTSPTETPNTPLSAPHWDGDLLSRYPDAGREKWIDGERALIFYTHIHRSYLYPEIPGERFMTEAVTWNRMAADGYRMRFFDDIIWIYEYKPDGLTNAGFRLFRDNPRGYALMQQEKAKFLSHSLFRCRYSLYCDLKDTYSPSQIADFLGVSRGTIQLCAALHSGLSILKGRKP